ncbi:LysR family transcriptional regulator [Tropicibacter oceani]|uniref:LysR family transcriptional regulator n=1 Tax=Tropicibacter oceani TaxID=3058420 RepID=A0ABY8QK83_9RHOB|nr:LysR family transcriptional regulator [Tropicibacter oceani]WGW04416.1 LysR family transcriptional regulator [Tropicibacter oceani]
MDWRSVTFDWNRARAFLVTAEEGSLSAAARALGMTQPTLGRQVTALEDELGVMLFERVGRGLVLTRAGSQLMDHVRAMGEAAAAVSLAASGQAQEIEGNVAITASEIYSSWLLPPILRQLRDLAPGITVEIVASNAIRDLKRREADIAIRNTRPDQPDLIGKLVAEDHGGFYATPDHLARANPIRTKDDLAGAQIIGLDDNANFIAALTGRGMPVTKANFPVIANTHPVHWEMARAGLGLGVGPCGLGESDPGLQRVLPEVRFDYPVWLVAHRELRTNPRVRIVWDLLAETLPALITP